MPTLQYPKNPNTDTAFVVQDDGTKNRALMTAPQDISTLELPNNPNSTKGYVTIDGKKQRVILTADISGAGGDQHNLGYYATQAALEEAHPTAEAGDWAIVGATDTVWIWDEDTSAWVDSDTKGQVQSVNGKTGVVQLNALDVDGVLQVAQLSDLNALQMETIFQWIGNDTTDENNTPLYKGWFYRIMGGYEVGLNYTKTGNWDYTINEETFMSYAQPQSGVQYYFSYKTATSSWKLSIGGGAATDVNLADYGITVTGGTLSNTSMLFIRYYDHRVAFAQQIAVQNGIKMHGGDKIRANAWSNHQATSFGTLNLSSGDSISVTPRPNSVEEWVRCGVRLSNTHDNGKPVFVCDITPTSDLDLFVIVFNCGDNFYGPMDTTYSQYIQYSTMPTAGADYVGKIVQYIGATDANYTNGYFYKGATDGDPNTPTYSWEAVQVQAGGGGSSPTATTVFLNDYDWGGNNEQTVNVTGITANSNVIVAPQDGSPSSSWVVKGIYCSAQGAGTLTFTCSDPTPPSGMVRVNVLFFN